MIARFTDAIGRLGFVGLAGVAQQVAVVEPHFAARALRRHGAPIGGERFVATPRLLQRARQVGERSGVAGRRFQHLAVALDGGVELAALVGLHRLLESVRHAAEATA